LFLKNLALSNDETQRSSLESSLKPMPLRLVSYRRVLSLRWANYLRIKNHLSSSHILVIRVRMYNTVVSATSKLKSIYDGVVFTSLCMTPS